MKNTKLFIALLGGAIAAASCTKDNGGDTPQVDKAYSVYLAGYYQDASYGTFGYYEVNGVRTMLSAEAGSSDPSPVSMAISGGKMYIAGSYFDGTGRARACYWTDGAFTKLDGSEGRKEDMVEHASSIVFSDGKVYVGGDYGADYNKTIPCYWVDGVLNNLDLPEGANQGVIRAIEVSGGKVYSAGWSIEGNARIPGYWIDNTFMALDVPDGASFNASTEMGIAVTDKVYVMGNYSMNSMSHSCVWIDGVLNTRPFDDTVEGAVNWFFAISDGKVYVSGYRFSDRNMIGCYWTDGVCTDLDVPAGMNSMAPSIGVIDGKVYAAGMYFDSSWNYKPCYWFDGVRTDLDIPTGADKGAAILCIHISE